MKKLTIALSGLILFVLVFGIAANHFIKKAMYDAHPLKYTEFVEKYSEEYSVPKEILYAVILTESSFQPDAVSSAGAIGLMQIMPDTRDWVMMKLGIKETPDMTEPENNIKFGAYYLNYLKNNYTHWETVFAAYNAGPYRVKGWLTDSRYSENGETLFEIPYPETKKYVSKVSKAAEKYKKLYFEK